MNDKTILGDTMVRRNNGICECGDWIDLSEAPCWVQEAVVDAVVSSNCLDMRREKNPSNNTDSEGYVEVDGQCWRYER